MFISTKLGTTLTVHSISSSVRKSVTSGGRAPCAGWSGKGNLVRFAAAWSDPDWKLSAGGTPNADLGDSAGSNHSPNSAGSNSALKAPSRRTARFYLRMERTYDAINANSAKIRPVMYRIAFEPARAEKTCQEATSTK